MCVPNFGSVGPTVQPAERKQTHRRTDRGTDRQRDDRHTHTDATENITFSANAGGKNGSAIKICRKWQGKSQPGFHFSDLH